MAIKCEQIGCPHEYEHCCIECEEKENCESKCTLKPTTCKHSSVEAGNELQAFKDTQVEAINAITQITLAKKKLEDQEKTMKEKLLEAMEQYGIEKFESDALKITYYKPSTTTTIDSKKLKEEKPDIAKQYSKTSNKKSYIKIEVKAGDK